MRERHRAAPDCSVSNDVATSTVPTREPLVPSQRRCPASQSRRCPSATPHRPSSTIRSTCPAASCGCRSRRRRRRCTIVSTSSGDNVMPLSSLRTWYSWTIAPVLNRSDVRRPIRVSRSIERLVEFVELVVALAERELGAMPERRMRELGRGFAEFEQRRPAEPRGERHLVRMPAHAEELDGRTQPTCRSRR